MFNVLDRVYVSKSGYRDYNNRSWTGYGVVVAVEEEAVFLTKVTPPIPGLENSDEIPVPFYFDTDCFEVVDWGNDKRSIEVGNWVQVNKSVFQNLDGSMWTGTGRVIEVSHGGKVLLIGDTQPPIPSIGFTEWNMDAKDCEVIEGGKGDTQPPIPSNIGFTEWYMDLLGMIQSLRERRESISGS